MPIRFSRLDYTHTRRHATIPAQPRPPMIYAEILDQIATEGCAVLTGIKPYRSRIFQRHAKVIGRPVTFSTRRDGSTVYRFAHAG